MKFGSRVCSQGVPGWLFGMQSATVLISFLYLIQKADSKSLGPKVQENLISHVGANGDAVNLTIPRIKSTTVTASSSRSFQDYLKSFINSNLVDNAHKKSRRKRSILGMMWLKFHFFCKFLIKEILFFGKKFG